MKTDAPMEPNAAETQIVARPVEFQELQPRSPSGKAVNMRRLQEIEVEITVEIGRRTLRLEEVQALEPGAVEALDSYSGEPMRIYANGELIAEGEPLVVGNDHFAVKIVSIIPPEDRLRNSERKGGI